MRIVTKKKKNLTGSAIQRKTSGKWCPDKVIIVM